MRGLRIAFGETVFFDGVDAEVDKAVRQAGQVFRGLGAHVDSMAVPEVAEAMADQRRALMVAAEALAVNGHLLDKHPDVLDPIVTSRMAAGRTFPASDYFAVMRQWAALRRRVVRTLADVDALIVPATMIPARPVSVIDATPESYTEHNGKYLRNTVARQYAGSLRGEPAVRVQRRGLADRPDDLREAVRRGDGAPRRLGVRAGDGLEGTPPRPHLGRRRRIRAHLLRWRPRQHAQRRETTPRVLPSGAASHLDPSPPPATLAARHGFWRTGWLKRGARFSLNACIPSVASGWWSEIAVFAAISSSAWANVSSAAL